MKILQEINYIGGVGADRWIIEGYHDAFERAGHQHFFWEAKDALKTRLEEVAPDVLMMGCDRLNQETLPILLDARKKGMKISLWVDSMALNRPLWRDILLNNDLADMYQGDTEPEWMSGFESTTGKKYHVTPHAANRKFHFPGKAVGKYECEIAFLGAWMPNKKEAFEMLLKPLKKKYNVKLLGPNWTIADNSLRIMARAAREARLWQANRWLSERRLSVPVEEERDLYSSAKISINVHERGEHIKNHVILNERTFKIPACGGFEMCDFVPPLRKYFTEEEMVMPDDKGGDWVKRWFEKIDYYLKHDAEREEIKARGTARALRDHTYDNRVERIMHILASGSAS